LYEKEFKLNKNVNVLGFGSSKGVDTSIFFPPDSFSLDLKSLRIGFIGRLTQDKGISDLIQIFKQLKLLFPNLNLDLIGFADLTDPVSQETIAFIQTSPDINWFQNLSHPEIAEKVRSWAIMIFPSRREGLPNAVIEAAACGTPTIGWKIGGVVDALPKKHLDFALSPGNVQQAISKVVEVIQRKDYLSIREDFASWAKENFDEKVVAGNFVDYVELQNEESNA
jgi:glycosyltransferase involved in cell wall biosynthesis